MVMMATIVTGSQLPGHCHWHYRRMPATSSTTKNCFSRVGARLLKIPTAEHDFPFKPSLGGGHMLNNRRLHVTSPDVSSPGLKVEILDALDDEYGGCVIDPNSLPSSANAFATSLRFSLSNWKLMGKKGIWLKILSEQADLIPIAIQEGFSYHHAEPGYIMLTYWIPVGPCLLPGSPSHHIGVGGFVINDKREILAVKEKCSCSCSGFWKMPTGYINKSEDLFSGAIREVKEETGVDTIFLKLVAFRHAHLVAFEKSDLLFMCLLKPLSDEITIDENEIEDAKWMGLDEFMKQPFYQADHMSRRAIQACVAAYEDHYSGFTAHQLTSKLDGKLSYLYYDNSSSF
ncbi:nudix hydrolase 8 isoform X2 [Ricinus communis]|uniref:Mutt domain protein, putative n=1 Tax=Ricinus communis TaxID=3988 RepID=B9RKE6_RICCO|nr:nudix hydrolase 8 isoform X2 [Ricinus communis]EEF48144.1 mutt domain protein, putative [Ricinus communis]|eukprot:XP_015571695.2 nudix hydrolase 8 isoform X2 [Ricinus communis]